MLKTLVATNYLFLAGLLLGVLVYPLASVLISGKLGVVLETIGRVLIAPFALVNKILQKKGDRPEADLVREPAVPRESPQEKQLNISSQAIRSIIQSLSVVILHTDQAASSSNQTLGDVRDNIGQMDIPDDLAEDHKFLLQEIDRMITGNTALKQELSKAQGNLAEQKKQIEELQSAVRLDGLTQLANRVHFDEKLDEMFRILRRHNDVFSLLLVDIDNFKGINDQFGHQAGDRILKGVAFKLRSALRESDFVARFGGDEFAILLFKSKGRAAVDTAQKLCWTQQETRFLMDGVNINVTLSIGVAEACVDDTVETVLQRADQALYQVKSEGRNGVRFQQYPVTPA